jgi:hypothetical protein
VTLYHGASADIRDIRAGFSLVDGRDSTTTPSSPERSRPARHGAIEVRSVREVQVDRDAAGARNP